MGGREESADNLLHPALHATRPSGTYFHLLWNLAVSLSYLTIFFAFCNLASIRIFLFSPVPELLATWLLSSHIQTIISYILDYLQNYFEHFVILPALSLVILKYCRLQ